VATSVLDQARVKEEIYNALNEAGIEIPFPQADVHVRADAVASMLAGQ
jgi:small-conductance mechanosensitive channel